MPEEKLIITLEVNAKGEAVLKTIKRGVEDLEKSTAKAMGTSAKARAEEKAFTEERERGRRGVQRRAKDEGDYYKAVDEVIKKTLAGGRADKDRTQEIERGRRGLDTRRRSEKGLADEVEKGAKAQQKQRDEQGKFVAGAQRTQQSLLTLAAAQRGLTATIASGVVAATAFLGIVRVGFAAGIGSITSPIKALAGGLVDVTTNTIKATEKFDRFRITLEGALKSASRAREVAGFVQEFALKTPVRVEELQDLTKSIALIPALRPQFFGDFEEVKKNLGDLYDTVIGLSSLNPQQGIPGAVFAIREALGGQFRSLRARFDIMPEIIAGSIGKTVAEIKKSPKLVIAALREFVDQSVGAETTRALGALTSVRIGNILEAVTSIAPRQIGTAGFSTFIEGLLGNLDDTIQTFFKQGGPFETKFAPIISDSLKNVVLQSLRIVGSLLGGLDVALGGGGTPNLDRFATVFVNVLGKVEDTLTGLADRLASKRENIAAFFTSIVEALQRGFDAFTKVLQSLPDALPAIGLALRGLVEISSRVLEFFGKIPAVLGKLGGSTLVSFAAPELARDLRQTGGAAAFGQLVQRSAQLPGPTQNGEPLMRDVALQLEAMVAALKEIGFVRSLKAGTAIQGDFQLSKDPLIVEARDFLLREFNSSADSATLLHGILDDLSRDGDSFEKKLRDAALNTSSLLASQTDLREAEKRATHAFDTLTKKRIEQAAAESRPESRPANNLRPEGLDPALFERVRNLAIPPGLTGLFGSALTTATPVEGEQLRRAIQGMSRQAIAEFQGAVSEIQKFGLEIQEKLPKLLLDPIEEAQVEFLRAEESFETSIEKLTSSFDRLTEDAKKQLEEGLAAVAKSVAEGLLPEDVGEKLAAKLRETTQKVLDSFGLERGRARSTAEGAFGTAGIPGFLQLIDRLTKLDPTNLREVERIFGELEKRIGTLRPALLEFGQKAFSELQQELIGQVGPIEQLFKTFDKGDAFEGMTKALKEARPDFEGIQVVIAAVNALIKDADGFVGENTIARLKELVEQMQKFSKALGTEDIDKLARFIVQSRLQPFAEQDKIRGAFGAPTAEREIQRLQERKKALEDIGANEVRIRALIDEAERKHLITADQRKQLEESVAEQLRKQREELEVQIASKEKGLQVTKIEEQLQQDLAREQDPSRRYQLIQSALAQIGAIIDALKAALADPAGQALALLLGIADPAKAREAAQAAIDSLEAARKRLQQQGQQQANANPLDAFNQQLRNVHAGDTVSASGLFGVLPEDVKQQIDDDYGLLGRRVGIAFLDRFELVTAEQGRARAKTFGEIFTEELTEFALKAADAFENAIGDTIFSVLTGDFENIKEIWDSFLKDLLRAFSQFIAQMIVRAAFSQIFGGLLGGGGGGFFGFAGGGVTSTGNPASIGSGITGSLPIAAPIPALGGGTGGFGGFT